MCAVEEGNERILLDRSTTEENVSGEKVPLHVFKKEKVIEKKMDGKRNNQLIITRTRCSKSQGQGQK